MSEFMDIRHFKWYLILLKLKLRANQGMLGLTKDRKKFKNLGSVISRDETFEKFYKIFKLQDPAKKNLKPPNGIRRKTNSPIWSYLQNEESITEEAAIEPPCADDCKCKTEENYHEKLIIQMSNDIDTFLDYFTYDQNCIDKLTGRAVSGARPVEDPRAEEILRAAIEKCGDDVLLNACKVQTNKKEEHDEEMLSEKGEETKKTSLSPRVSNDFDFVEMGEMDGDDEEEMPTENESEGNEEENANDNNSNEEQENVVRNETAISSCMTERINEDDTTEHIRAELSESEITTVEDTAEEIMNTIPDATEFVPLFADEENGIVQVELLDETVGEPDSIAAKQLINNALVTFADTNRFTELKIAGQIRKIAFLVLVHNQIYLEGVYVSGTSMRNVKTFSPNGSPSLNLHMAIAYDLDSNPFLMVITPTKVSNRSSNTFVSCFLDTIIAPRKMLMPFCGADQSQANAREVCPVLFSIQHLFGGLLCDFAKDVVFEFRGVRFNRAQIIASANGDLVSLAEWILKLKPPKNTKRNFQLLKSLPDCTLQNAWLATADRPETLELKRVRTAILLLQKLKRVHTLYSKPMNAFNRQELSGLLVDFVSLRVSGNALRRERIVDNLSLVIALHLRTGIEFIADLFGTLPEYDVQSLMRGKNSGIVPNAQNAINTLEELELNGGEFPAVHALNYGITRIVPTPVEFCYEFEDFIYEGMPEITDDHRQKAERAISLHRPLQAPMIWLENVARAIALIECQRARTDNRLVKYVLDQGGVITIAAYLLRKSAV